MFTRFPGPTSPGLSHLNIIAPFHHFTQYAFLSLGRVRGLPPPRFCCGPEHLGLLPGRLVHRPPGPLEPPECSGTPNYHEGTHAK